MQQRSRAVTVTPVRHTPAPPLPKKLETPHLQDDGASFALRLVIARADEVFSLSGNGRSVPVAKREGVLQKQGKDEQIVLGFVLRAVTDACSDGEAP